MCNASPSPKIIVVSFHIIQIECEVSHINIYRKCTRIPSTRFSINKSVCCIFATFDATPDTNEWWEEILTCLSFSLSLSFSRWIETISCVRTIDIESTIALFSWTPFPGDCSRSVNLFSSTMFRMSSPFTKTFPLLLFFFIHPCYYLGTWKDHHA